MANANIAAAFAGADPMSFVQAGLPRAALIHVHDNFGARRRGEWRPGVEPMRLDVHLPPGDGTIDWDSVVPALVAGGAPMLLEVHPPHRPEPAVLSHLFHRCFTTA